MLVVVGLASGCEAGEGNVAGVVGAVGVVAEIGGCIVGATWRGGVIGADCCWAGFGGIDLAVIACGIG